jgi:hypothetical protein
MKHEIECALNAIECARENVRDANDEKLNRKLNDSQYIYDIANMYIDDDVITCECAQRQIERMKNELRNLYDARYRNLRIEISHVYKTTTYQILITYQIDHDDTYIDAMIVDSNDVTLMNSNFNTFRVINEMNI